MSRQPGTVAKRAGALLVYLLLLVAIQVFLLVVALEGVLAHEPELATVSAALSCAVFLGVAALYRSFGDD